MARAHDGKVADNGTFILSDWCSSEILTGVFYAFNENGVELLRVNYAANLFSNGISEDGRFAACQTCSSNDEKDSAVLSIFDLVNGKELCRFRAKSGWPTTIEFSANGEFVVLGHQNNARKLKYMLDGKFFDRNF